MMPEKEHSQAIARVAYPLNDGPSDYDPLLEQIGEAHFVLLGEASHGTHEFYRARAAITRRLIAEKGFTAVAVEADWPDAYRVNCYVRGQSDDAEAIDALANFKRFPTWMWRNADVLDFLGWLRDYNDAQTGSTPRCGFYGLDLYSLYGSVEAVLKYLEKTDPEAAQRARDRYACFENFEQDAQAYGYATARGVIEPCEEAVVEQLLALQQRAAEYSQRDGRVAEDKYFYAEQNARLVKNAEEYYRSMFRGRASSWNLRDSHMAETLDELAAHLSRENGPAKIVVWAHNSHLGDARATEMSSRGEHNLGQLVRQKRGSDSCLIGFSTYSGTVTAASDWDKPAERKRVRPGLKESYEALFHAAGEQGAPNFLLDPCEESVAQILLEPRLERAIGVIYRPETERWSHYFYSVLPHQFDAVLHFDRTRAVEPLEREARWERGEAPETYPSGV